MHHDGHNHNLPHQSDQGNVTGIFVLGILLNIAFVVVEFVYGFISHSLGLMADAWHNLGDVAGLAISLLALRMAVLKPNATYTYGFSKGTILASLANSVLLLIAVGSIGYEAIQRFVNPQMPDWETISVVAGVGILINSATAFLFFNKNEMNSKAACLHMAADTMVSVGVVAAGFVMHYTGWLWVDPFISLVICAVILAGTWRLLKSSLRLSLDGVPEGVDIEKIRHIAASFPGVTDIHHLHVWALSTTKNAMTAHLLIKDDLRDDQIIKLKSDIKHELSHQNIHHITLEFETRHTDEPEECDQC